MEARSNQNQRLDFAAEVARIMPSIMRELTRRQKTIFSKDMLSVPQLVILELLRDKGPGKMGDLAKTLNLTMSAVTAIVDKMIELKLVKRERSTRDRRVVNVAILTKGRQAVERARQERHDCINSLFASLTEAERAEYLRILTKAYSNLSKDNER